MQSSPRRPSPTLLLASLFILLALCLAATPPPTRAATGSISGTVTDENNNPLEGIEVQIYFEAFWGYTELFEATATTDAQGQYTVGNLDSGTYRVEFSDPNQVYAIQFYSNKPDLYLSDDISVTEGQDTPDIDAQMALAASISGNVGNTAGTAIEGVRVGVYRDYGSGWGYLIDFETTTDAGGNYSVEGLPAGIYRLGFEDLNGTYLSEFYNNAADVESATDVNVTAGQDTPNIDVQLAVGGSISGIVTDPDGNVLSNVEVTVYRPETYGWAAMSHTTSISGTYTVGGLNTGTYRVGFYDGSNTYATEFYNDATDVDSATDVSVTAGQNTPNIDVQLAVGGSISGTVTDPDGNVLENVWVQVYSNNEFGFWVQTGMPHTTAADGTYTVGGLATGTYRIEFGDYSSNYMGEFYDNAADVDSATDISVTIGQDTPNIDVQLAVGGSISGTVTDPDDAPLAGIGIMVYSESGIPFSVFPSYTDTDGTYTIGGLPGGTYRVSFSDSIGGRYLMEYYDNAPDLDSATRITVTTGEDTPNIDAQLAADPDAPPILPLTKSSRYAVRNMGTAAATVTQTFYNDGAFSSSVVHIETASIDVAAAEIVDLTAISYIPADYSGEVVIQSDQPVMIDWPVSGMSLSDNSVAEDAALGTLVGTLSASDPNRDDSHSFSLVAGAGAVDNAAFSIEGAQLKTAQAFDYETKNSYSIRIRATDRSGFTFEETFTITITEGNHAPTDISLSNSSVDENADVGTVVGTLSATDSDAEDTHTFSLVSGAGATDHAAFTIAGSSLKTVEVFDYETQNSFSIRVRATDGAGLFTEKELTITVIDLDEGPALESSNGAKGAPGSAFAFVVSDLAPNTEATIQVGRTAEAARLAADDAGYLAGTVQTDATGTARFALFFPESAQPGAYTITVNDGSTSVSTRITLDPAADTLTSPDDTPVLRAQATVYLPLMVR
ncbi:MAG: carboxypeptidase regulatory-like domain-containing protein [Chloroflexaceae bacterium]